ncbi:hypothetical protein GGI43DRAFT_79929 [Trichoderma evansii]
MKEPRVLHTSLAVSSCNITNSQTLHENGNVSSNHFWHCHLPGRGVCAQSSFFFWSDNHRLGRYPSGPLLCGQHAPEVKPGASSSEVRDGIWHGGWSTCEEHTVSASWAALGYTVGTGGGQRLMPGCVSCVLNSLFRILFFGTCCIKTSAVQSSNLRGRANEQTASRCHRSSFIGH